MLGPSESAPERSVKWPIKALFFVHLVFVFMWCLPHAPRAVANGRSQGTPIDQLLKFNDQKVRPGPTRFYLMSTGLWQYWDMFAPDPLRQDNYLEAEIRYADGTLKMVDFPRMANMTIPERYVRERYQKFAERVQGEEAYFVQPDVAQWMALQHFTDPQNPPVGVNLRKRSRDIPPPPGPVDRNRPFGVEVIYPSLIDEAKLYQAKGWRRP